MGDVDRYFRAFDVNTKEEVRRTRLGSAGHGFPITYAVDGKQYIAVPTGMGVMKLLTVKQSPENLPTQRWQRFVRLHVTANEKCIDAPKNKQQWLYIYHQLNNDLFLPEPSVINTI